VGSAPLGPPGERPEAVDPRLMGAAAMVFVDQPSAPVLSAADIHHLVDVLRLRPGEPVISCDGHGAWVPCRMATSMRGSKGVDGGAVLVVDGEAMVEPLPTPGITVAFAPTKGDRPEWVTQKLTELGVDRIVPIHSARSVVRWKGDRGDRALEKLARVVREASAQCRRTHLPRVGPVVSLDDLETTLGARPLLAHPGGGHPSLAHPVVAIGPEGGWSDEELAEFGPGVGLGPTVLRAETAAVAAGTLLCGLRSGVVGTLA
jgi:16S rRNA (uracil1498-N3)-methyltransferase